MAWCLLALIAVSGLASGCGSEARPPQAHQGETTSGQPGHVLDYWSRQRLLTTQPLRQWTAVAPLAPSAHPPRLEAARVGALFEKDATGNHFCTASVVASPGHDVVMTAAHCVNDGRGHDKADIVFIPGYADGATPYGVWTPRRVVVDPEWAHGSDPDYDVGFVVLNSRDGANIQDVLGANEIAFNTGFTHLVRVTGYPSSDDTPVTCRNWTPEYSTTQLRFACGGFYGGTSGSPWMTTDAHQIVGVIGGHQEGGATDSVSYSAYLGDAIQRLYQEATTIGKS